MKKPKSLKECKTTEEAQKYILENDGLSDEDFQELDFVEVGPDDDLAEIIPVPLDSDTAKRVHQIAKKTGRTPNMLIGEWAAQVSRRELTREKEEPPQKQPKKKATG